MTRETTATQSVLPTQPIHEGQAGLLSAPRHAVAHRGRQMADESLALALACGALVSDAAREAGVGVRTAYRRLEQPDFRRRVQELRSGLIDRALGKMADGMVEAAQTLRMLLKADRDSVRLQAARSLLELGCRLREHAELNERVLELEAHLPCLPATPSGEPI